MPLHRLIASAAAVILIMATLLAASCGSPAVTPTPSPTPQPTSPVSDFELQVMVLENGKAVATTGDSAEFTVATWGIPVVGITRPDAVVSVNGGLVDVNEDGLFVHEVDLLEGPNLIEVVASDMLGSHRAMSIIVYQISSAGIPLHVLWPAHDGMLHNASVPVFGATRSDAVVSIDGNVVDVSPLGLFHGTASLEPGPNIIDVTASDLMGNTITEQLVVYLVD